MSVAIDLDVQLGDKVEKLSHSTIVKVLEKAVQSTALDTEKELKQTAPVDTGNLRRSIGVKQQNLNGFIITGAHYWVYLNYGTSKMDANPFVTEAASGILADYNKNLKEQLKAAGLQ